MTLWTFFQYLNCLTVQSTHWVLHTEDRPLCWGISCQYTGS